MCPHPDGLLQGGVGVAREDHVDPVHLPGQLVVLPLAVVRAAVGEADDEVGLLPGLDLLHHPLAAWAAGSNSMPDMGRVGSRPPPPSRRTPRCAGGPRRRAAPLDDGIVGDAVVLPGRPALGVALRGAVVGLHDGGEGLPRSPPPRSAWPQALRRGSRTRGFQRWWRHTAFPPGARSSGASVE